MRGIVISALASCASVSSAVCAQGVGGLRQPGDESYWGIELRGAPLGHCWSRYEGEVALGALRAHRFREQVALDVAQPTGSISQRLTLDLWLADDGRPLRFDLRARVGDARTAVRGVLAGGKAELAVQQGPAQQTLARDVPSGSYLLANNFVSHLELLLALEPVADEGASLPLFSVTTLQPLTLSVRPSEPAAPGEAAFEDSLGQRLHLSPDGRLARVEVPSQGVVFRRAEVPASLERFEIELAVRPVDPLVERTDVRIDDGEVSLAGSITRPAGVEGELPGLFFLSGSDEQDRDGFAAGVDLGTHEILDHLTRAGFLVLRVDDRGIGGSTGPTEELTFADLVEDGRRALRHLLERPDVDPERVALIGHSEGGLVAPLLASSEPVAAVVLMAAPGRPLDELIVEQLLFARELAGAAPGEREAYGREVAEFLARIGKGEPVAAAGLAPELAAFLPARAWLASHVGRDALGPLAALRCPVLVLQGARDVQVSVERDTPRLREALERAGHTDHRVVVFPELDHLFKRAGERPSELDYLRERPVDGEFLALLTDWLRERLAE